MKRHIWLIISWLRLRQVCWFSFRLLCKLLRHWAKRMSYFKWRFWYISFPMRLCHVRFLFLVIYCAVQTPYTLRSKKYLEKHARWNNFWLRLSSVRSSSFSLLRKLLRHWAKRMSYFKWRFWYISFPMRLCHVRFLFLVIYCAVQTPYTLRSKKYLEKHARWNNFWLRLSSVRSSSFSLLRKLLRRWAREKSKMTTHNWHIDTWMRLCQAFVRFPVVYCSNLLRHWATRRRNM